jgi:hypothetical protein
VRVKILEMGPTSAVFRAVVQRHTLVTTLSCLAALASPGLAGTGCGGMSATTADAGKGAAEASITDDSSTGQSDGSATARDSGAFVEAAAPTPVPDYFWYVLDETQGSTAHDSAPHHFDITNLASVTWNQGANFNGVAGGGYTNVDSAFRVPPITISAWLTPVLRADSPNGFALRPYPANALSGDIPAIGGYALGLNVWSGGSALSVEAVDTCYGAGALCVAGSTQNARDVDGGPSCLSASSCDQGFVAGAEHFVLVSVAPVADGGAASEAVVYVDGELFDQTTAAVFPTESTAPLYLGSCNLDTGYGTSRIFDGRIRDVRAYKRQLGAAEAQQLYVNGPTRSAPARPDASSSDGAAD